jgi:hypothetical protein
MTTSGPYAWAYDASSISIGNLAPTFTGEAFGSNNIKTTQLDLTCMRCQLCASASLPASSRQKVTELARDVPLVQLFGDW